MQLIYRVPAKFCFFICLSFCLTSLQAAAEEHQFDLDLQANWYRTLSPFSGGYNENEHKNLFSHKDHAGLGTLSVITDVATDAEGNAYGLMVSFRGTRGNLTRQLILVKYGKAGDRQWYKPVGEFDSSGGVYDLALGPDQNIYVVGSKAWDGGRGIRVIQGFVACFAPTGKIRWSFTTKNKTPEQGVIYTAVAVDQDSVFLVGATDARIVREAKEQSSTDILLTRLNLKGKHVWTQQFQGEVHEKRDRNFSLTVAPNGTVCLASSYSFFPTPNDGVRPEGSWGLVLAVDQRGKKLWAKRIGIDTDDLNSGLPKHKRTSVNVSIASDEKSNFYIAGTLNEHPVLTKLSPTGKHQWTHQISDIEGLERHEFFPNCVRVDGSGNAWLTGAWDHCPAMICYSSDGQVLSAKTYAKDEIYTSSDFDFVPGTNQAIIWGKCVPWLANKDPQNYGPQYFMASIDLQAPESDNK